MSGSDPIVDLAGQLGAIASQLAVRGDAADTTEPGRVLYDIAGTLDCLIKPVTALCARAADGADESTAAELATVGDALQTASRAVRTAQRTFR